MTETFNPESHSSGLSSIKITAVAFALVMVYVLSTGPVWWLHQHGFVSRRVFETIYLPLGYLMDHCPGDLLFNYITWWAPLF